MRVNPNHASAHVMHVEAMRIAGCRLRRDVCVRACVCVCVCVTFPLMPVP